MSAAESSAAATSSAAGQMPQVSGRDAALVRQYARRMLQQQDESNKRFWSRVELVAALLESTAGKDKVLKLSQYGLRVFLDFFEQIKNTWGEKAEVFGRVLDLMPTKFLGHARILSKQISTSRKLFRLGRTIHAWYMVRQLLDEPNVFLQIVGLCSWFWNGVYFLCDHSAYLKGIGILKTDPLLRLNKISVVAMQTFLFLFNCRKLALSLAQERHILAELEHLRLSRLNREAYAEYESRQHKLPDLSAEIKAAIVGTCTMTPEILENQPEELLLEALSATRNGRLHAIYPEFIKNIGDGLVCYDFGFDLGLPSLMVNSLGLVASLAGIHLEVFKARKRKSVLLKTIKPPELGSPVPAAAGSSVAPPLPPSLYEEQVLLSPKKQSKGSAAAVGRH